MDSFIFSWNNQKEAEWEILVHEDMIRQVLVLCKDYSKYQNEPFFLGSSHHRWLWFYQEHIPKALHTACAVSEARSSLSFDDYGTTAMEAYVSEKLKSKENEYTSKENLHFSILTWNVAGTAPKGNLAEWILAQSRKYGEAIKSPDLIVIGLQEMCELTKLLGDQMREQEWAEYIKNQVTTTFNQNYVNVFEK